MNWSLRLSVRAVQPRQPAVSEALLVGEGGREGGERQRTSLEQLQVEVSSVKRGRSDFQSRCRTVLAGAGKAASPHDASPTAYYVQTL